MGGAASSLASGITDSPTGNEFSQNAKTQELKKMSDALFQFMYSKWELKEIFDITEKPGEYVIAISDLITSEFHVLGYTTKANKIGEIYFRKWEELDPPQTASEYTTMKMSPNITRSARIKKKEERYKKLGVNIQRDEPEAKVHAQHAKIIAFYFVRIFQILGSLLLVVKDGTMPVLDNKGEATSNDYRVSNRQYAYQGPTIPRFRPLQSGGAEGYIDTREPLGAFEFLRYYLRTYDSELVSQYAEMKVSIPAPNSGYYKISKSDSLFFEWKKPDPLPSSIEIGVESAKGKLHMLVKRKGESSFSLKTILIKVTLLRQTDTREFKAPGEFPKEQQYNRYPFEITIETKDSLKIHMNATFQINDTTNRDREYAKGAKYKIKEGMIVDSISGDSEISSDEDIEKILEKYTLITISKQNRDFFSKFKRESQEEKEKRDYRKEGGPAAPANPWLAQVFNELNNTPTKDKDGNPVVKKRVPHCIARALDLLDTASINNLKALDKATTKICTSEITKAGSKYVPLKSIGQLYGKLKASDIINVNEDAFKQAIVILDAFIGSASKGYLTVGDLKVAGQADEATEFSNALKRLFAAFNTLKTATDSDSIEQMQVTIPSRCKDIKESGTIDKNRPIFKRLQAYSQQLLALHLNKVINISKFLMSIFNVSQRPDSSWKVEGPKTEILFAGFGVLDQLTDTARELLIDYYSGCEELYQKGVKDWNEELTGPAAAAGAVNTGAAGNASAGNIKPVTGGRRLI